MRIFYLLLCLFLFQIPALFAQSHQIISLNELFPAPDKELPKKKDLSASLRGFITPDSVIFELNVKDDKVMSGTDAPASDHVEIWFGFHECDFSDFLVSDARDREKSRIFRNSIESTDNADLERFLKLGDYPAEGKIRNPSTLEWLQTSVPPGNMLRKENVFYGISSFACFADNRAPVQLNRDKYKYLEEQLFPFDDLSGNLKYKAVPTEEGYKIRIALHNSCLLFGVPFSMNEIRFAVQVHDADKKNAPVKQWLSSAKNNYYARPFYFNKAEFPFPLNIRLNTVPEAVIKKMNMRLSAIRSEGTWKPYYYSNGSIIYAPEMMSDAGLVEYNFFSSRITYRSAEPGAEVTWGRLDIEYEDLSAFKQHEIYFMIGDSVTLSSKEYRFLHDEPGDFVNSIFKLKDGSVAAVLYDFEPVDPMGWGPLGKTADEYVYIQKLDKKSGYPIFNVGQRVESAGKVAVGNPLITTLENVKHIRYRWLKFGETFEMQVDSDNPDDKKTLQFIIGADNKVSLMH